jgi:hypothetical protein
LDPRSTDSACLVLFMGLILESSIILVLLAFVTRDLIPALHHHNKCTTPPHMRVDSTHWAPPSCEGVLCSCCVGAVNLTFFLKKFSNKIIKLNSINSIKFDNLTENVTIRAAERVGW